MKNDSQMGSKWEPTLGQLLTSGPFLLSQAALGAKVTPKAFPKSPEPVQASLFIDCGTILDLFLDSVSYHAGYFWSSLSSYLLSCSISFIRLLRALLFKFLSLTAVLQAD